MGTWNDLHSCAFPELRIEAATADVDTAADEASANPPTTDTTTSPHITSTPTHLNSDSAHSIQGAHRPKTDADKASTTDGEAKTCAK